MAHNSALLLQLGQKYRGNPYLDFISFGDSIAILLILVGLILLVGFAISRTSKRRRRYPPDDRK